MFPFYLFCVRLKYLPFHIQDPFHALDPPLCCSLRTFTVVLHLSEPGGQHNCRRHIPGPVKATSVYTILYITFGLYFLCESFYICPCWISYAILLPSHSMSHVPPTINHLTFVFSTQDNYQHMLSPQYSLPFTGLLWQMSSTGSSTNPHTLPPVTSFYSNFWPLPTLIFISTSLMWRN